MSERYDWTKLPDGWRYYKSERYGDEFLLGPSCVSYNLADVEHSKSFASAREMLESCRIPEPSTPPDTATVTALRPADGENGDIIVTRGGTVRTLHTKPADEYDWSRLEGSGWRYPGASYAHIECDRWAYYYDSGSLTARARVVPTDPDDALRAHQDAHALVAKCRRDWRDDVMGAAPIPAEWGAGELHAFADAIVVHPLPGKMKLTCGPHRRMELDGDADLVGCLRLSIVIERLKKLGWREA